MVGTSKISFIRLSTSDTNSIRDAFNTNSFRDAFNDEIIFIASFIPTCFSSTIFLKVFIWVSNLNLSRSLLKSKDIAKVQDQNLLHATLLKAVFPLPEDFQEILAVELLLPHNDSKFCFLKVVLGHRFLVSVLMLKLVQKTYRN